jgi:beta-galactosidase
MVVVVALPPKRGRTRRAVLAAGLAGGAGVASLPFLAIFSESPQNASNLREASIRDHLATGDYEFNDGWLFGGEYSQGSTSPGYDDSSFASITLPHTVVPLSWRAWDPAQWERVWIYRRHFDAAAIPPGHRVIAKFDGVMVNATAVLNGNQVASHQGGYLPWTAELTRYLSADDNVLAVVVDARSLPVPPVANGLGPDSIDFLQPGGIYRDVRLRIVPQAYLSDVFALPVDVLTSPRVDIECTVDAAARLPAPATLKVDLLDGDATIATTSTMVPVSRPGTTTARLSLTGLRGISLWHTSSPKLYTVQATLVSDAGPHTVTQQIGFREAAFREDGFFLNGERLQIFGLNRHQIYPFTGMAMPSRVQRRDAEILKYEFNCNMVRCSHYPQSPHFLDACDELGLLVWQEAPGWHWVGNNAWQDLVEQNVRDMVVRDRGRPSVIIWGTRLNETGAHSRLYRSTRQLARKLDGSRPTSGAMNIHSLKGWAEDVFAYDDYNHPHGSVKLLPPAPGVPYLLTEAVGVVGLVPKHFLWTDRPAWLARQATLHAQAHAQAAADQRYCGLLGWCGFDYSSLQGPGADHIKSPGVADMFRIPKPGAAIYQSQADPRTKSVIVPVLAWDFHFGAPPPGPGPNMMIATNCDRVEVRADGAAVPVEPGTQYAHLAYPPVFALVTASGPGPVGQLEIAGFVGGRPVAAMRMSSDPSGFRLVAQADDEEIVASGSDATRVSFRVVDAFGNQVRYRSGEVTLRLSGPATLIGEDRFPLAEYGGPSAVWVRSIPRQTGTATLIASHTELGSSMVDIRVIATPTGIALA